MDEGDGPHDPLDHSRCDHDRALDDLCATVHLLRRWPEPPEDARLRFGPRSRERPVTTGDLEADLAELNELAGRLLGR